MALGDLLIKVGIDGTNIGKDLAKVQRKLEASAAKFSTIGANISMGISAPLGLLANQAITTAAEFETLETGLQTLTGSVQAGSEAFERLKEFSAATPFQLQDLVAANNTMMGFGLSADDAFTSLNQLGDIAAVMGSDLNSMSLAFGQSAASGVAMTADINQFINQGVPMYKLLGEVTGKSTAELKQMASESKITFPLIQKALKQATSEGGMFFEGMAKGSQTIGGVLSTFKDKLALALGTLGQSIAQALNFKTMMANLGDVIGRITNTFAGFSDTTKRIIVVIVGAVAALGPLMFALGGLTNVVVSAVSGLRLLNTVLLANPFVTIAAVVIAVAVAFKKLYDHSNQFKGIVHKLINTFKNTFSRIFETVRQLVQHLAGAFGGLTTEGGGAKDMLVSVGEFLGKIFVGFAQRAVDVIRFLVDGFIDLYNSSDLFRGVLFGLVKGVKTMIEETLSGLGKLAKAISLLFKREFKEAGKVAMEGAKQFATAGFTAGAAMIDGFKEGRDSKGRLKFGVIEPEEIADSLPDEKKVKDEVKPKAEGVGDAISDQLKETFDKIPNDLKNHFSDFDFSTLFSTDSPNLSKGLIKAVEKIDLKGAFEKVGVQTGSFFDMFGERLDKMSDKFKQKFTAIGLSITGALQVANDLFNRHMESQQRILDERHQLEISRIEASTASEEVKQKRKAVAEKRYEKQSNAIKKKMAQRDKARAIFEATINTAAAIAKVAANPFLVPVVAALGAAQVAMIAATPIPMAKGGILSGPTNILAGEYMGARNNPEIIAPLDKLRNMINTDQNINLSGSFRLTGDDLLLAVEQANKTRQRQGGITLF